MLCTSVSFIPKNLRVEKVKMVFKTILFCFFSIALKHSNGGKILRHVVGFIEAYECPSVRDSEERVKYRDE